MQALRVASVVAAAVVGIAGAGATGADGGGHGGLAIRGIVVDENGRPLPRAVV